MDVKPIDFFQETLLNWFEKNGRVFPWRKPNLTGYQVIISEILLQRTKASNIAIFFPYFIQKYPDWTALWEATENELKEVLKSIGLHNQKAKRLHQLSQEMARRKGSFPENRTEIDKMPMIGQYIANSYELFVRNKKVPLLDVNMVRLIERYFGPRRLSDIRYDPYIQKIAHLIVDVDDAIAMNWAVLDFAALVCKPNNPLCSECPLRINCKFDKNKS